MFHRILIMVSQYISSNFNYGNPYATFKLIMASTYASSNFNYGELVCELNFNYNEFICFIEF